ncbi:hypothetical protein MHYP_G00263740 [Metynnis hypsauchen]
MQSCSSADHVLILLIFTFTTVSTNDLWRACGGLQLLRAESNDYSVKVKLHDSATLPCSERCSGLARWTVFHKRLDTLAECDRTSCRSVKEGYQMIHDQYLKGNHSLIITDADFTKRGWYTCDCDNKDICDVRLQIERKYLFYSLANQIYITDTTDQICTALRMFLIVFLSALNTTVEMMAGESLILRLDVSDPVVVIYNSTAGPSSGQICTVDGPSLQCKPEYAQRSSLTSGVELREIAPSDSGVYIIVDKKYKEVIHTYTVAVQDFQQTKIWKDGYRKGNEDGYRNGFGIGAVVFGIVALALGVILGMLAGPRVRALIDSCVLTFRAEEPSGGLQAGEGEGSVSPARSLHSEL